MPVARHQQGRGGRQIGAPTPSERHMRISSATLNKIFRMDMRLCISLRVLIIGDFDFLSLFLFYSNDRIDSSRLFYTNSLQYHPARPKPHQFSI